MQDQRANSLNGYKITFYQLREQTSLAYSRSSPVTSTAALALGTMIKAFFKRLFFRDPGYHKNYGIVEATPEEIARAEAWSMARTNFQAFPQGFSLVRDAKSKYIYYRDGDRVLKIYAEISGTPEYDLIYIQGLEWWVYPEKIALSPDELTVVRTRFKEWLRQNGYYNTIPAIDEL